MSKPVNQTTQRQILYSAPMVRAKLTGLKSQTRRIRGNQLKRINASLDRPGFTWTVTPCPVFSKRTSTVPARELTTYRFQCPGMNDVVLTCPFGEVGDLLWGKETVAYCDFGSGYTWCYRAEQPDNTDIKWTPSLFMPKAAARIWDRITGTRLERLQDISETDAIAEGLERWKSPLHPGKYEYLDYSDPDNSRRGRIGFVQATSSYHSLWESLHGRDSWHKNPYVWVIETEPLTNPAFLHSANERMLINSYPAPSPIQ